MFIPKHKGSGLSDCFSKDHFFIGTDNGIFNLILNSEPDDVVRIDHPEGSDELEIFAKAASDIMSGKKPSELGKQVKTH